MMRRRALLTRVAAVGAAATLAGCTGEEGTPEGPTDTGSGGSDPTETPTAVGESTPTPTERSPTATSPTDRPGTESSPTPRQRPRNLGAVHAHGTITVTVLGDRVDLSRREYQLQDRYFHLEGGNGRIWHVHGQGVTLAYAMDTVGIGVTDDSITYQGTTYEDGSEYDVTVTVGGRDVTPPEYVLEGNRTTPAARRTSRDSHIRIVVESA
jgi:hypothetical protein